MRCRSTAGHSAASGRSLTPHAEHGPVDGTNRPILPKCGRTGRPCTPACPRTRPAGVVHRFRQPVRPRPATHRSSTYTAWLSRMIRVDILWCKSRRVSATLACARATATRALSRLLLPGCLRARDLCSLRSLRSARRRNLRGPDHRPVGQHRERRSGPGRYPPPRRWRDREAAGVLRRVGVTTNEAKYRPAASRITVTLDGGRRQVRDQRTSTSPIFGSRSRPLGRTLNRAFAVNRIACRRSLRDRNRGGCDPAAFALSRERGEEVPVGRVQVREGLLEHHRGDLGEPRPFRGGLGRW